MIDELLKQIRGQYTDARNTLAFMVQNPGQGSAGDTGAHGLHEGYMRSLARRAGEAGVHPGLAVAALTGVGYTNEALSGLLEKLRGKAFYSEKGYDQGDLDANARGLEAALADLIKSGAFKPGAAPNPSPAPPPPPGY